MIEPSTKSKLTALSAYSGAGGMDLGLEMAGFDNVGCIEIDTLARESLHLNRPGWNLIGNGDVVEVAKTLKPAHLNMEVGELDLLAGGPPCQPFSSASQWAYAVRRGMGDTRAQTIHSVLDLIERFQPKAVMLENVLGFVSGRASALPAIENHIDEMRVKYGVSYQLHWKAFNAADFGVAQNRRRVILVILRDDVAGASWAWPTPTHIDNPVTAWEAIGGLVENEVPTTRGKWADLLPSIPEGNNYQWLTSQGGGMEIFGYRTRYWNFLLKLAKNQPSWTLAASPGPSAGPFHWDNRPLSAREMLRIQSFPDEWKLVGDYRAQVKLAGNATPPLLAEVMARSIRAHIGSPASTERPRLTPKREVVLPAPREPEAVPIQFAHLVGPKLSHPGSGKGPGAVEAAILTTQEPAI